MVELPVDSFDVVFYTCIFLLPGFVIKSIIDAFVAPAKHNETKYFFTCLLYSIVNCALLSWAYLLLNTISEKHPIIYWILLAGVTLIGATFIGFFIGLIRKKELIDVLLKKIRIEKIPSIPTAWDYYFSKQKESFVIITLKDDTKMYGWYSSESFVSSDCEERDIYIQIGYKYKEDAWIVDEESEGFYIPKEQIKIIEFKKGNSDGK